MNGLVIAGAFALSVVLVAIAFATLQPCGRATERYMVTKQTFCSKSPQ